MATPYTIHTSILFDPKKKEWLNDMSVTVDPTTGCITKYFQRTEDLGDCVPKNDIDLRGKYVLPGFVDAHTHIFLHSYQERASLNQKRDESPTERIIRAVNHCRTALLSGFTTYRDLGSESMQNADAGVRDAINRGLTPGPRLFVATKVLASSGAYESRTENPGTCLPAACHAIDGPEDARRAVRERITQGADIIKFYADYRRRIMRWPPVQQHPYIGGMKVPPAEPNPDVMVFDREEMDMIVRESTLAKAPVACHAKTYEGVKMAVEAGALTIEHGYYVNDEILTIMKEKGTILIPTLAIAERLHADIMTGVVIPALQLAHKRGVRLAVGGDTGTYPHGQGIREAEIMIEAGLPLEDVLESCSVGGWEACGGDLCGMRFGWFEEGLRADLIAFIEDPRKNYKAMRRVDFVMKDATVWKQNSQAVGMVEHHHKWDAEK
ncbi:hypothetical protein B7463_g7336, partial [Scytalidium lignicola]